MNTVRSLVFFVWLYGGMAVIGVGALPAMLMPRRFAMGVIRLFCRYVRLGLRLICGVKVELRGREHIPDGPLLIAGKHQAMLDVFIPFLLFSDPALIMKRELLWYPALGWFALKSRMIPIDRAGTSKTLKTMVKEARARTGEGRQVVIYPEGTRQPIGAPLDYKPAGVTALYNALGVAVLPLATNSGLCWKPHGLTRRPGLVVYEALPPLPAGLNRKQMYARLEAELETASDRLVEEGLAVQGRSRRGLARET
ncbi:MAG: lysophospholipid acyltransferase family protein [Henriciella sp.]|uniref:lysophospholipid acyltransferase family protein n=1 Tax=Henriciella sp. TaxID=1968823 RepID=UPI003C78ED4F